MTNSSPLSGNEQAFWAWFRDHSSQLDDFEENKDSLIEVVYGRLQQYHDGLGFEISAPGDGVREFVISFGSRDQDHQAAIKLAKSFPGLEGWKPVVGHPARGFEFALTFDGKAYAPAQLSFLAMRAEDEDPRLGLRVYGRGLGPENLDAVVRLLIVGLGEAEFDSRIGHVEVAGLEDAPDETPRVPIPRLPSFLDWWRKRHSHRRV